MRPVVSEGVATNDLLASVAEQLKVPLTVIARQAELSQLTDDIQLEAAAKVRTQAEAALQLVDSYLLGLQLMREQLTLELEPVSVSSTLVDTAHTLSRFAQHYDVEIEVEVAGRYEPVMAHARGFRAALLSLGYSLVEAQAASEDKQARRLRLATHRTPHGIIAGVYGPYEELNSAQWRAALKLCGNAAQPYSKLSAGPGAGLFVADTILRSMNTKLRVGHHARQQGLAATFCPSRQLQFV